MPDSFNIEIKGLDEAFRKLDLSSKKYEAVLNQNLGEAVVNIDREAKRRIPRGATNQLAVSNRWEKEGNLRFSVFNTAYYAPYVEFGTRSKTQVPAGLSAYAAQFKGKGRGDFNDFLKAIKLWCRRKGIDEKAAWPIAISILNEGTAPQPFLFPSYENERPKLIERLKQDLK